MKTLIALFLLLTISCSNCLLAADGAGSSGGGYRYSNTSYLHLRDQVWSLMKTLSVIPQSRFDKIVANHTTNHIDLYELQKVLLMYRKEPTKEGVTRINDGVEEEVMMDYDLETKSIIALKPFFEFYDKVKLTEEEKLLMMEQILHEATHVFLIGVDNDQVSAELSKDLVYDLQRYGKLDSCGLSFDTLEKNAQSCGGYQLDAKIISQSLVLNYSPVVPYTAYRIDNHMIAYFHYSVLDTKSEIGSYIAYPEYIESLSSRSLEAKFDWETSIVQPQRLEDYCKAVGAEWGIPSVDEALFVMKKEMEGRLSRGVQEKKSDKILAFDLKTKNYYAISSDLSVKKTSLKTKFFHNPEVYWPICSSRNYKVNEIRY